MKRVKIVPKKCPNPLFEKWLLEWRQEARIKSSRMEIHFSKAIQSLRKYPLPLETGRDCILLQHFGTKLCAMLDKKLKSHTEEMRSSHLSDTDRDDIEHIVSPKKSRSFEGSAFGTAVTPKKQIDANRNANSIENIDKSSERNANSPKRKQAKPNFCRSREHSLSSSCSGDSVDLLIAETLGKADNKIPGEPVVAGKKLNKNNDADKLKTKVPRKQKKKQDKNIGTVDAGLPRVDDAVKESTRDQFRMAPNSFDVFLLVDIHETAGRKTKTKDDATISELNALNTQYEIRHLKVGDFAWVARCRETKKELVLPYVVERKRMDDLASSIKDGRFHEQKFRLKRSGIPNIIYMVESYAKNQHVGLPLQTLLQACTNTLVQDGFNVKYTKDHRNSMQYLSILTNVIQKLYKNKSLVSSTKENLNSESTSRDEVPLMEFQLFNKAASKAKTFNVKEMFVKHLLQLKGVSVEKALAIVELYPTPVILTEAFQRAGKDAPKLLASIQVGPLRRQLGPALSKTIFELYTKETLD